MTHPRRSFSTSPAAPPPPSPPSLPGWSSRTSIPSVHGANPAVLFSHPALVAVTAAAILFHLRLPVPLPMSTTDRSLASLSSPVVLHHPSANPLCLLDQRPGDGTTRKAGFKIIMARAILITVARTTTISGWHHHYKSVVRGAATPPTTTAAALRTLLLPIRLISHCTYRPLCESAIDVRSGLCKDTAAPKDT